MCSIATIQNHCDAVTQAIQKLQDVKEIFANYDSRKLLIEEVSSSLRQEKQSLSKKIVDMKQQLRDLGEELTDTHVLTHVYYTSTSCSIGDDDDNEDQCFPETTTEVTDPSSLESENDEPMHYNLDDDDDCTQSVSSSGEHSLSVVVPHKKRRHSGSSKWYKKSPKKWRRMMRSNRLQSIILLD